MSIPKKEYLGDGVYAEFVDGQVHVTSEDGEYILEVIILEPETATKLVAYFDKILAAQKEEAAE